MEDGGMYPGFSSFYILPPFPIGSGLCSARNLRFENKELKFTKSKI
jgi:hypothetical protein